MDQRGIAACRPVEWTIASLGAPPEVFSQLNEAHIYPGSHQGACERCGQGIWIGPKVQEFMLLDLVAQVVCFRCAGELDTTDATGASRIVHLGNTFHPAPSQVESLTREVSKQAVEQGWDGPAFFVALRYEDGRLMPSQAFVLNDPVPQLPLLQLPEEADGVVFSFEGYRTKVQADQTTRDEVRITTARLRPSFRIPTGELINFTVIVERGNEQEEPQTSRMGVGLGRINDGLDHLLSIPGQSA